MKEASQCHLNQMITLNLTNNGTDGHYGLPTWCRETGTASPGHRCSGPKMFHLNLITRNNQTNPKSWSILKPTLTWTVKKIPTSQKTPPQKSKEIRDCLKYWKLKIHRNRNQCVNLDWGSAIKAVTGVTGNLTADSKLDNNIVPVLHFSGATMTSRLGRRMSLF